MKPISHRNHIFTGAKNKSSLYDLEIPENWNKKLIIFIHGYMGFKDWGCWNLVEKMFNERQYGFLKYNISHGGTSTDNAVEFVDLPSFSKNTYSNELEDLEAIIRLTKELISEAFGIYIIGHSRGGGIGFLMSQNPAISKIVSWAGISNIADRFPIGDELLKWQYNGIRFQKNSRTNQELPISIEIYNDYQKHKQRLDIEYYCLKCHIPALVIHGDEDQSVSIKEGMQLALWTKTNLEIIEGTGHTFDVSHPWTSDKMPEKLLDVCKRTIHFFNLH